MVSSRISLLVSRLTSLESRKSVFLAAVLLIAGAAALPLFSQSGLLNTRGGGDSPFLLQRLQQLMVALADGHFPVRWMPDANYGYGYPFYNFYAPLSIYIASFFRILGFSYVLTIKLAQLTGFLVAAGSMFALGRRWFDSNWAGLLAACAYTFAPFHLVNVYVRGDSLAEFWAMAFYPIVVLSLDLIFSGTNIALGAETATEALSDEDVPHGQQPGSQKHTVHKVMIVLAIGFASLVLSHNISALIFAPFLLFLFIISFVTYWSASRRTRRFNLAALVPPVVALTLGLAISAWFWMPALVERTMAQMEPITSGYFHFSNHFRSGDLIQARFLFDYDVENGGAFRMGLLQALLTVSGSIVLLSIGSRIRSPDGPEETRSQVALEYRVFIMIGLIVATFMITPLSQFLWERIPLLPFVQFPWRFLSVQAFFTSLAIAGLALLPRRQVLVPAVVIVLILSSLIDLKLDFLSLSDRDVTSEYLAQYEWFTGNIGSTVSAEYLPSTVIPRPYTSNWLNTGVRNTVQVLSGELISSEMVERGTTKQRWQFTAAPDGVTNTIPTIEWPEWTASVEQESVAVNAASGSGLIESHLFFGEQELNLALTKTPIRWLGELAALAGLVVLIGFLRPWRFVSRKLILLIGAILLMMVIIARFWPEKIYADDDLTWDFDQLAYLHHAKDGLTFENGAALDSYQYSADQVNAGEQLTITLNWKESAVSEATIAFATPAINRHENAPPLVSLTSPVRTGLVPYQIQIPENAPKGLYIPRLTMADAQSLTPSGKTRGDLFLRPIRIGGHNEPAVLTGRLFDARLIDADLRPSQVLDVKLQWATAETLTENLNFSLRLVDNLGNELAQLDNQPGYGYLPSSLWPREFWIDDWLALPLPADVVIDEDQMPLALVARLYNIATGEVKLTRRLGELRILDDAVVIEDRSKPTAPPDSMQETLVDYVDDRPVIRLRGYELNSDAGNIDLNLYWESLENNLKDYQHFVHLIDLTSGQLVAQHDAIPRNNSYPTSQWSKGEIVVDPLMINIEDLAEGNYALYVGLYYPEGNNFVRLAIVEQDIPLADDSFLIPEIIEIN